jgi:hypothetical protein
MSKSNHTEGQMIGALKHMEKTGDRRDVPLAVDSSPRKRALSRIRLRSFWATTLLRG